MRRTLLSLQVVARRLPSVLKDMDRTTSVWWLMVRTGFLITASGQSRFQIITCTRRHDTTPTLSNVNSFQTRIHDFLLGYRIVFLFTLLFAGCVTLVARWGRGGVWCYLVVIGGAEEDVVGSWVPLDEAHSAAVTLELLPGYCDVLQDTVRRNVPHLHLL